MSDDRWEVYHNVCKGRFKNMEDKIDKVEDKVDKLTAIVTNGLTDKVTALWKLAIALICGIVGVLGLTIFDLLVRH